MSKIMELFAEWDRRMAAYWAIPDSAGDDVIAPAFDFAEEVVAEIVTHPATSMDDMAAKIVAVTGWRDAVSFDGRKGHSIIREAGRHMRILGFEDHFAYPSGGAQLSPEPAASSLFEQWKAAMAPYAKAEADEEAMAAYDERCALLDRMVAEPSVTLRDFAMKLVAATGQGADYENVWISKLLAEACDIAGVPASRDLMEALA